jgi:AraC-like DNA-binding protein
MVDALVGIGSPGTQFHPPIMRTVQRACRDIVADEQTLLRIGELAQYFQCSRWSLYRDMNRGYEFEFGTTTTPNHYRAWLRAHPVPRRRTKDSRLAEELAALR